MIQRIKLTSKRQVTFPSRLCEEMGVHPGDDLFLRRKSVKGDIVWELKTSSSSNIGWFGTLRKYAKNKSHNIKDIREIISRKRHGVS